MQCPQCGHDAKQAVRETRKRGDGGIARRRACQSCGHTYWTIEQLSESGLQVRKSDGRIVPFVKDSIRTNIATAAAPELPIQRLEELVDAIVAEVYPLARTGPISTAAIAEAVLSRLKEIDPATHIRFALAHARRHGHGRDQTRWSDTEDARRWLVNEYPHLHHTPALRGLSYVIKRDSRRKRYDRVKLERSIDLVSKGRGTGEEVRRFAAVVADDVERALGDQPVVTTGQIAAEVLRSLRTRDPIAYLRYASTAKRFSTPEDYEAEALALRAVASKAPSD